MKFAACVDVHIFFPFCPSFPSQRQDTGNWCPASSERLDLLNQVLCRGSLEIPRSLTVEGLDYPVDDVHGESEGRGRQRG